MMKSKYLLAFMDMTERFAQTSVDERLKVGACLIKNDNPIAFGINGTIPGWETNTCQKEDGTTNEEIVLHAEVNLLNKLRKINESSVGGTLLVTHAPCIKCAHHIVDAGIVHVYYRYDYRCNKGLQHLKKKGIKIDKI